MKMADFCGFSFLDAHISATAAISMMGWIGLETGQKRRKWLCATNRHIEKSQGFRVHN
ncbi:hypothetical protein [Acidiphilium sp.]|uniref:hypothetical protein n=1 Tax=Acidiphilium sp. TaxID=527 RepID=UPI00259027EC|nr:hypothetical protein [Acidiphilium sp.]